MIAFTIPLSAAWRIQRSSEESAVAKPGLDDSTWKVASLDELPSMVLGEAIWIRKRFALDASEDCLRYRLCCTPSPLSMYLFLRGHMIAEVAADSCLALDITNQLSLDDNLLAIEIKAGSRLVSCCKLEIWLEAEFCY